MSAPVETTAAVLELAVIRMVVVGKLPSKNFLTMKFILTCKSCITIISFKTSLPFAF